MIDGMQRRHHRPSVQCRPSGRVGTARLVLVALMAGVGALAIAPSAGAHGDDGVLSVVSATPSGTSSTVTVELTYEGAGHPVDGATVTVVADDGAGRTIDPVPMGPGSAPGQYTATVEYPSAGTWNLRVTAVSPAATVTLTQDATADPGVTAVPSTTVAAGGGGDGDAVTSSTVEIGDAATDTAAPEGDGADEDSSPLPWILGGLAVVVCVGLGVVFVLRGRDPGSID
jgi:hypothetical protein